MRRRNTIYRQAADVIGGAYRRYRGRRGILSLPNTQSQGIMSQAPAFAGRMAAAAVAGVAARRALTQTRRVGRQVAVAGGGESKSKFSLYNPSKKISALKLTSTNVVTRSVGSSVAATQGVQNSTNMAVYWDMVDLGNAFTSLGQTTSDYNAAKILLTRARATNLITNAESTNVHFTLYDVMAKTSVQTSNSSPNDVFTLGFDDANTGASANYTVPGALPEANPRFKAGYRILQKTEVILGPGATHSHVIDYAPNKIVSKELITMGGATGPAAGVTLYTFIILHGTPVHDDTTETSVTLGAAKLDFVIMEHLEWKQVQYPFPTNSISTTLATNLTGFQMADGAPADVADAS